MKRTSKFKFPYLEVGDMLYRSDEFERWTALDVNLGGVSSATDTLGGVAVGLTLGYNKAAHAVVVSPGVALIGKMWIRTTGSYYIPVSEDESYTVYASPHQETKISADDLNYSYTEITPTFGATDSSIPVDSIELGTIDIDNSNNETIDESTRNLLVFGGRVKDNGLLFIRNHKHKGPPSPSKIDLANHIKNTLNSSHLGKIPGSKISSGLIDTSKVSIGQLSHIGRVKEECKLILTPCYTQDNDYQVYTTDPWEGNVAIYKNGEVVSGSLISNLKPLEGTIVFNTSANNTSGDRISICRNLRLVEPVKGTWDAGLRVDVFVNRNKLNPEDYTVHSDEGTIELKNEITASDSVICTIYGVNITDVGDTIHDDIDYWLGEKTSWMGWWPSWVAEYNLNQALVNYRDIVQADIPMDYQMHSVILPDDWDTDVGGGNVDKPTDAASGPDNPIQKEVVSINIEPTLPPGPEGGLFVGPKSQSFVSPADNISKAAAWLGRVGSKTDYTLVASLVQSDGTNLPLAGTTIGYTAVSVWDISKFGDEYRVNFTGPLSTNLNGKYALVLSQQGGDADNYIEWWGASENYPLGSGGYYDDSQWDVLPGELDDYYTKLWTTEVYSNNVLQDQDFIFDTPAEKHVNPYVSIIIDLSSSNQTSDPTGARFPAIKKFISDILDYYADGPHTGLPKDKTAIFDLITFVIADNKTFPFNQAVEYKTDAVSGIYALLGSINNVTNEEPTLNNIIDAISSPNIPYGVTPLSTAMYIAAERLNTMASNDDSEPKRKKMMLILTDGAVSDGSELNNTIEYIKSDEDNPILVYCALYGTSFLSSEESALQYEFTKTISKELDAEIYVSADSINMNNIVNDVSTSKLVIQEKYEKIVSLAKEVFIESLTFDADIPGGSSAQVFIYTAPEASNIVWEPLNSQAITIDDSDNSPPPIEVNKFAKHIKFEFIMQAGSLPSIGGGTIYYKDVYEDYIYTVPYPVSRPIHEISMGFSRIPDMMPEGTDVRFAVSPGLSTNWDSMIPLTPNSRDIIPGRLDEPTTTDDYLTYTLKYGKFTGATDLKVYSNGVVIDPDLYSVNAFTGKITFQEPRATTDTITVSVIYGKHYRIAVKTKHTANEPHVDFAFAWHYTIRPR